MFGKKVLFIDRDGVINRMMIHKDGYFDSPQNINEVELVPGIIELIRWLNHKDILVVEISNQPGVAKGKMSMKTLESIENKVHSLLKEGGVYIDKVYRCFHHPQAIIKKFRQNCECRKPNSGLLFQAVSELKIDLSLSVILGDNVSDMEAGKKASVKTILFLHEDDIPQKVEANRNYEPDFKVTTHKEVIEILTKIFA